MSGRIGSLVVIALLVIAGCVGPGAQTSQGTTAESTATSLTSTETTSTRTTSVGPSEVVAFEDLPPKAQEIFHRARRNGSVEGLVNIDSLTVKPLFEHQYVRYRGERYRIRANRKMAPRLHLGQVKQVNGSTIDDDAAVVPFEDLNDRAKQDFTAVRTGSRSSISYKREAYPFPKGASGDRFYVKFDGEFYSVTIAQASVWRYGFWVSNTTASG